MSVQNASHTVLEEVATVGVRAGGHGLHDEGAYNEPLDRQIMERV